MTWARDRWIMKASCFTVLIGGRLSVVSSLVKPGIGGRTSNSERGSWQRVRSRMAMPFASTERSRLTLTWTKLLPYSGWLVVESYKNATGGSAASRRQHWNNARCLGGNRRMLNFSTAQTMAYKSTQLRFQSWRETSSGHMEHFVLDSKQQAQVGILQTKTSHTKSKVW